MEVWFKMIKTFQYRDEDIKEYDTSQVPSYTIMSPAAMNGMPKPQMIRPPTVQQPPARPPPVMRDLKPKPGRGSIGSDNGAAVTHDRSSSNGFDDPTYYIEPETTPNSIAPSPHAIDASPIPTHHHPGRPRYPKSSSSISQSSISPSPGPPNGQNSPYRYPPSTPVFVDQQRHPSYSQSRVQNTPTMPGRPPKPPNMQPGVSNRVPATPSTSVPPFVPSSEDKKLEYVEISKDSKLNKSKKPENIPQPPRPAANDDVVEYNFIVDAEKTQALANVTRKRQEEALAKVTQKREMDLRERLNVS